MGVHDFRCHLCGETESFNAAGESAGLGAAQSVVAFFAFPRGEAPADVDAFLAAPHAARSVTHQLMGYDWGDWEFQPCLDYRTKLMDGDESAGDRFDVWRLNDSPLSETEAAEERMRSEGDPIAIDRDPDASVWVVNVCPDCWSGYLEPGGPAPCQARTNKLARLHGLAADPAAVRAHVAWLAGPAFGSALKLNDET